MSLKFLLDHHHWANDQFFDYILSLENEQIMDQFPDFDKSLYDLLYHLYEVNWNWLQTITSSEKEFDWNEEIPVEELISRIKKTQSQMDEFVEQGNLSKKIILQFSDDDIPVETNPEKILLNFITHAAYHRGQIALLLRYLGFVDINETDINPFVYQRGQDFSQ